MGNENTERWPESNSYHKSEDQLWIFGQVENLLDYPKEQIPEPIRMPHCLRIKTAS